MKREATYPGGQPQQAEYCDRMPRGDIHAVTSRTPTHPRRREAPKPAASAAISPLLLRVGAAADALGICERMLYKRLSRGEIRSVKIGRVRLIPVSELEAYVARLLECA